MMVTNTIKLVNGYPDYIGWWCLGGEAPILVNDDDIEVFWTWVRLPPSPPYKRSIYESQSRIYLD